MQKNLPIVEMDHKKNNKKKDIFYLIKDFLIDNGFRETADCLSCEAELSKDTAVCDNISLETIVIEFEIFYFQRFKIHPQFCKKISCLPKDGGGKKLSTHSKKKLVTRKCPPESNPSPLKTDFVLSNSLHNCESESINGLEIIDEEPTSWTEYHETILQSMNSEKSNVKWQDIKGLDDVKELLREAMVYPIKYPHLFTDSLEPWRSILMFGPPGTGKTSLANAVATESNAAFFNLSSSLIVNKWRGDTEKLIKVLFELASKKAPSVIFIDEIDALVMRRSIHEHEASRRMKSELFSGIDKLIKNNGNVLVLAATNTPWDLDRAMLRRFEKHVYVPPPDDEMRRSLLQHFLPQTFGVSPTVRVDIDYDFMVKRTEKYTGCDIKNICKNIKMTLVREIFSNLESSATKPNASVRKTTNVTRENLENIMNKFKPMFIHSEEQYLKWPYEYNHDKLKVHS